METKLANFEENMTDTKTHVEEKFKRMNNEVRGLRTTLIEGFNELKDVLSDGKEENTKRATNKQSERYLIKKA
jgi:hypothetical protein